MPKKGASEFYYDEKRGLYRKRIKNPATGKWQDIYGHTKQETRDNVRAAEAAWSEAAQIREHPLFYQYAKTWYDLNTQALEPKSREVIANSINNHICPVIGGIRVEDLKPDDAQRVMATAAAAKLSKESQKKILNVMRRIVKSAVRSELIRRDVTEGIKAQGAPTKEKTPLTKEQQQHLIDALVGTQCQVFAALCLYAGLRREEALGLCWDSVNLVSDPPYISVRRTLVFVGGKAVVSDKLKSAAAKRDIPIPPQLTEILKGLSRSKSGHVIADANGGPMSLAAYRSMWRAVESRSVREMKVNGETRMLSVGETVPHSRVKIALDFHVQPHQLRHTYITELVLAGANVKTVQYLAGHSSVQLTLSIYTHLVDRQPAQTFSAVVAAFAPGAGAETQSGAKTGASEGAEAPDA